MPGLKGTVTEEDLKEVPDLSKAAGTQYKTHPYALFAHLFGLMAEEAISKFEDEGRRMMGDVVKKFGEERGRRIAETVKALGGELTLANFLIYGDLWPLEGHDVERSLRNGEFCLRITRCPFQAGWAKTGRQAFGRIYCEHIDQAILRGYNPELVLEVPSYLTKGDEACLLIYKNNRG